MTVTLIEQSGLSSKTGHDNRQLAVKSIVIKCNSFPYLSMSLKTSISHPKLSMQQRLHPYKLGTNC